MVRACLLGLCLLLVASCSTSAEVVELPETGANDQDASTEATELTNEDVFRSVQNSIVFVQTPDLEATGSGIVIQDRWILTNAHVVDRYESVRIGRSDGVDLGLHPVGAVDWIFDLALVGPINDAALEPMQPGASAELPLGSRVLLIGFPDEPEDLPTPTLTEGIISRRRSVAVGDYPFLQVDATIAPGQSGGALVNANGELVGISGLQFGAGEFGLAFASDGMYPRVQDLIATPPSEPPPAEETFELSATVGSVRTFGFLLDVDESGQVDVLATSDADLWIDFLSAGSATVTQTNSPDDPFRLPQSDTVLFVDEMTEGGENLIATVEPGTYQVVVGSFADEMTDLEITAINAMRRFPDIEDGLELPINQIVEGASDWTRDADSWELTLAQGDDVTIVADGISDTLLAVRLDDELIAASDDAAVGLFGTGSAVSFVAESAGTYIVEVGTFDSTRWGYLLEATVAVAQ